MLGQMVEKIMLGVLKFRLCHHLMCSTRNNDVSFETHLKNKFEILTLPNLE